MVLPKNKEDLEFIDGACNASGVAQSMANAFTALRESGIRDTSDLNKHPVIRFYLVKLADLAGMNGNLDDYTKAYFDCVEYFKTVTKEQ